MAITGKPKVILVHSYKGGTGKTTIAVNLAQHLATRQNKRVLLIEQDMGGPTFTKIFNKQPRNFWNDYLSGTRFESIIEEQEYFDVVFAKEGEIDPSVPLAEFFMEQVQRFHQNLIHLSATKGYEYVILDTRPGKTKDIFLSIPVSNVSVLTTRLDIDSIGKTIEMYNDIYGRLKSKQIILVQNQVPQKEDDEEPDGELDREVEKSLVEWKKFVKGKDVVSIPLSNKIAYGLFRNRIIKSNNPLMNYIAEIAELFLK
ncbi:MAG: tyrosine-protein kinase family protein [Candidatus Hodarchaeales archaeon]